MGSHKHREKHRPERGSSWSHVLQDLAVLVLCLGVCALPILMITHSSRYPHDVRKFTNSDFDLIKNDVALLAKMHDEMLKGMEHHIYSARCLFPDHKQTGYEYLIQYMQVTQRYIELLKTEQNQHCDERLKSFAAEWLNQNPISSQ